MATQEYYKSIEYQKPYRIEYYKNPEKILKRVWNNMIQRCTNPKSDMFYAYGKKGIKICNEWLDFNNFKNDMLSGFKDGLSIDRIDNNGSYCKENCRWSTPLEQAQNTSRTKLITFNKETMTLPAWARKIGVKRSTLSMRYYKYNWSLNRCLTT